MFLGSLHLKLHVIFLCCCYYSKHNKKLFVVKNLIMKKKLKEISGLFLVFIFYWDKEFEKIKNFNFSSIIFCYKLLIKTFIIMMKIYNSFTCNSWSWCVWGFLKHVLWRVLVKIRRKFQQFFTVICNSSVCFMYIFWIFFHEKDSH